MKRDNGIWEFLSKSKGHIWKGSLSLVAQDYFWLCSSWDPAGSLCTRLLPHPPEALPPLPISPGVSFSRSLPHSASGWSPSVCVSSCSETNPRQRWAAPAADCPGRSLSASGVRAFGSWIQGFYLHLSFQPNEFKLCLYLLLLRWPESPFYLNVTSDCSLFSSQRQGYKYHEMGNGNHF